MIDAPPIKPELPKNDRSKPPGSEDSNRPPAPDQFPAEPTSPSLRKSNARRPDRGAHSAGHKTAGAAGVQYRFAGLESPSAGLAAQLAADPGNADQGDGSKGAGERPRQRNEAAPPAAPSAPGQPAAGQPNASEEPAKPATGPRSKESEPVVITRGADGRLIITSRDTEALDAVEDLMTRLTPPRKDYAVFYLKYATASIVKMNLDEYFGLDKKDDSSSRGRSWYFGWDDEDRNKKDVTPRLSQRKPLRFIYDPGTNSILVQGASPDQLRIIEDLIDMYDRPEPQNSKAARMTRPFPIKHSRANAIAEVIKDVYRDLLSANDKALQSFNESKNRGRGGERTYIYGMMEGEDDGKINQGRFKGQLSVGVEESSNTLIVSCPEALMRNIENIVEYLDKAAVPTAQTMQVLRIDRSIDAGALQKKLAEMLGKPTGGEQQAHEQKRGEQQEQKKNNGNNKNKRNRNGREGSSDSDNNSSTD
jgi:hypothetical protein